MSSRLFGIFVCWVLGPTAFADVLILKNGDRITGTINSVTGGKLLMKTAYAGNLSVDLAAIATAESKEALDLRLDSGERVYGQLTTDGVSQGITTDEGMRTLTLTEVDWAVDDLLKGVDHLMEWKSTAEALGSVATGNSDTATWGIRLQSNLAHHRQRHLFNLAVDQADADGVTTKDQLDFDYGYRWLFADAWYLNGIGEYFFDKIKGVDERITVGGGFGYQFWENTLGALSAELGGTAVFEEIDGLKEKSPAARWALRWNRFLAGKRVELFHDHRIVSIFEAGRGEIVDATVGVRYRLNDRINTNLRVDLKHETQPAPGKKKTDFIYGFGLGLRL